MSPSKKVKIEPQASSAVMNTSAFKAARPEQEGHTSDSSVSHMSFSQSPSPEPMQVVPKPREPTQNPISNSQYYVPDPIGSSVAVNNVQHGNAVVTPTLNPVPQTDQTISATIVAPIAPKGGIRHNVQNPKVQPSAVVMSKAPGATASTVNVRGRDQRSFSFQLNETTNNYQKLSFEHLQPDRVGSNIQYGKDRSSSVEEPSDRKQKRLERNRESARLSRKRRKQYLEDLERSVNKLSEDMDQGRRDHVFSALKEIDAMRNSVLSELDEKSVDIAEGSYPLERLQQRLQMLGADGILSKTSAELQIATTFGREYLRSLTTPFHIRFVMWLTLQNDVFFRGGRAASERLSAARIGEKVRKKSKYIFHSGNMHLVSHINLAPKCWTYSCYSCKWNVAPFL